MKTVTKHGYEAKPGARGVSRTDEFTLGVDAPVRDSGKTKGSAPIILEGPKGSVKLDEGLICARRRARTPT